MLSRRPLNSSGLGGGFAPRQFGRWAAYFCAMNLEESWNITRHHLGNARNLLPASVKENVEFGTLERLEEWLFHNELELALDEIEGLGELNDSPAKFWEALLAAAENMNLQLHVARYEFKLRK